MVLGEWNCDGEVADCFGTGGMGGIRWVSMVGVHFVVFYMHVLHIQLDSRIEGGFDCPR